MPLQGPRAGTRSGEGKGGLRRSRHGRGRVEGEGAGGPRIGSGPTYKMIQAGCSDPLNCFLICNNEGGQRGAGIREGG